MDDCSNSSAGSVSDFLSEGPGFDSGLGFLGLKAAITNTRFGQENVAR